jgi:hypothetical protein
MQRFTRARSYQKMQRHANGALESNLRPDHQIRDDAASPVLGRSIHGHPGLAATHEAELGVQAQFPVLLIAQDCLQHWNRARASGAGMYDNAHACRSRDSEGFVAWSSRLDLTEPANRYACHLPRRGS